MSNSSLYSGYLLRSFNSGAVVESVDQRLERYSEDEQTEMSAVAAESGARYAYCL